jgi:hypothetical protein
MHSGLVKRTVRLGLCTMLAAMMIMLAAPLDVSAQRSQVWDYSGQGLGIGGNMGLGVASAKVGVGFQFGFSSKIKIYRGLYLDPGWHMFVKSGAWMMTFCPAPQYIFRFRDFPLHPYGGFGPTFNIAHGANETKARMGLHWTVGAEWLITEQIAVYQEDRFHLVFKSPDVFTITAGMYYYLW